MIGLKLTYSDLDIRPVEIYEQMGYGEATPDAQTMAETEALVREISAVVRPKLCFFITDGSLDTDRHILSVMGQDFAVGGIISRQLLKSRRYVF
ncbi:MAG: methionine synthase, partial [Muribaculaceae bacterium]|nr:methionine synthase [Muribaculaceae bacterium]